ncbi:MAG TPA: chemotaxis response regulator protein-glutamate methylesterase [Candidatus Kapabacteria bacterium]|nr:chemotaxis response regulator protein-glutamate methylesterase [Candidatus Kapabacteria bacterium]
MNKIKILVVDDSFFMRKAITKILTTDETEVIGTAINGKEGVEKALLLNPDVITMDIEMPVMNGLDAVSGIIAKKNIPILMLSTLTVEGAEATVEALSRGAVDFVTKKAAFTEVASLADEILAKIKAIISHKFSNKISKPFHYIEDRAGKQEFKLAKPIANKNKRPELSQMSLVVIGISTGGPAALNDFVPKLSPKIPVPIVVAQHMPPFFTKSLADRLNSHSKLQVKEIEDNDRLLPGNLYICPGGKQTLLHRSMRVALSEEPKDELFKPSVNVLLNSAIDSFHKNIVGIIMTGMGNDGSKALKRLSDIGGYVISQDIDSCVVAGMPKAVIDLNIANEIHPLSEMANAINSLFSVR